MMNEEIMDILFVLKNIGPEFYVYAEEIEDYINNLQKKAELGDHYKHLYSEVKKQKDDVVELIKKQDKIRNYYEYEECGYDEYNYDDDFKEELLEILEVEKNE